MGYDQWEKDWMLRILGTMGPRAAFAFAFEVHWAGGMSAYYSGLGRAIALPAAGAVTASIVVPIIGMIAVFTALGAPYYTARKLVEEKNSRDGFSQGFVTGLLNWQWYQVVNVFRRYHLRINVVDPATDLIRVNAYHVGLRAGYLMASAIPRDHKKAYLRKIHEAGAAHGPKAWSRDADTARNQQVSLVIELAVVALRHGIIKPE